MLKKISEMTAADKAEFLERTKQSMLQEQGIPWEFVESKIIEDIENTFDDPYRLDHAVTAAQKDILQAFNLTAVNVEKEAKELGKRLRTVTN